MSGMASADGTVDATIPLERVYCLYEEEAFVVSGIG
jgi:hypothetical protein